MSLSVKNQTGLASSTWGTRCWFWRDQFTKNENRHAARKRPRQPLVLTGHGVSVRIEGGSLSVRNGLTHYPQRREAFRYFCGGRDLPEQIVLLNCSGNISIDAISWLSEQGIPLIRLDWQGTVTCVSSQQGFSANPFRAEWQRLTRADNRLRMDFCNRLIIQKIESSIAALEKSVRRSDAWEHAMETAYATLTRLEGNPAQHIDELRGIEGTAAAAYFRAWNDLPVHWRKRSRRPLPPEWQKIGVRSSGYYATGNSNARHPIQAILNYAYAVLLSQLQILAVTEGFDPTLGIMHESRPGSPAFLLDVMEPRRAEVDRAILDFVKVQEFDLGDFAVRSDGVCRLNPELARRIAQVLHSQQRPKAAYWLEW